VCARVVCVRVYMQLRVYMCVRGVRLVLLRGRGAPSVCACVYCPCVCVYVCVWCASRVRDRGVPMI